ncbi:hypothetical protein GJ744_002238 [Endocarpon pusillum]|uniref:NB-ARC domain-containing protein n=1 Tax=Endocarpon pusillum TaxID=364733 RepID=A0A8H7AAH8_9EURO|nr:hypothetical protein GJ744_002238 [Endocarpon pusillum]
MKQAHNDIGKTDGAPRGQCQSGCPSSPEFSQPAPLGMEDEGEREPTTAFLDELLAEGSDLGEGPLAGSSVALPQLTFQRHGQPLDANIVPSDSIGELCPVPITDESSIHPANTPRRRKRKLPLSSTMPPKCQPFIGRTALLSQMYDYFLGSSSLEPGSSTDTNVPRVIWIYGPGGIGKTQLALEYCSRSLSKYDIILWINASTRPSLGRSFHDCAIMQDLIEGRVDQNHLESRIRLLKWLESSRIRWLLVLDAIDECFYEEIVSLLPQHGAGSILISSQIQPAVQPAVPRIQYIKDSTIQPRRGHGFPPCTAPRGRCTKAW